MEILKKEIRRFLLIILMLGGGIAGLSWYRYQRDQGLRFAARMGAGINLGNSLDVVGLKERKPEASVRDYELYWNNPPISGMLLASLKSAGFGSVRIPVSWGEHLDSDGQIDPQWMDRVEHVVDLALAEDLFVVLNLHHETWLIPLEEKEEQVTEQFCFVWRQIADRFSDRGERLLFESMNEPRLEDSPLEWNGGNREMQQVVNRLNAAFVETVRNSGGENKKRYLILPGYGHNYSRKALDALELPGASRLMVAVHAYLPYQFALKEEGTDQWSEYREEDTEPVRELMEYLHVRFTSKGIPVLLTEFGCADRDNPRERMAWAGYYTYQARKNEVGYFWWDQGGDMQLFDRETGTCLEPELVRILTGKKLRDSSLQGKRRNR